VFWTNDVPKSYKEMSAKGIEFLGPPKTEEWGTSAMFRDADGNQFLLSSK
jgi:predicted enzyme related to lactoylglutathione lyase